MIWRRRAGIVKIGKSFWSNLMSWTDPDQKHGRSLVPIYSQDTKFVAIFSGIWQLLLLYFGLYYVRKVPFKEKNLMIIPFSCCWTSRWSLLCQLIKVGLSELPAFHYDAMDFIILVISKPIWGKCCLWSCKWNTNLQSGAFQTRERCWRVCEAHQTAFKRMIHP